MGGARQLSMVELGGDLFEQSLASGKWPCEFVAQEGAAVMLKGEWLKESVSLDLDGDGKLRAIVEIPVGKHEYELVRAGKTERKEVLEVKELDRSINRFSGTVFGGSALKNVAADKGASTGARQLATGEIEFTYNDVSYAKRVWVVGDFSEEPLQLTKDGTGYRATADVAGGKHEFRFRVDIGEALTAEAGPQSRLGWHAGTTTGSYLSTNVQEFTVEKSKLRNTEASKPKQQVKQTELKKQPEPKRSMAAMANAAKAVIRTKGAAMEGATDRGLSPTVEEVTAALEAAGRGSKPESKQGAMAPSPLASSTTVKEARNAFAASVQREEDAVVVVSKEAEGGKRGFPLVSLVAVPVLAVLAWFIARKVFPASDGDESRGDDEDEPKDSEKLENDMAAPAAEPEPVQRRDGSRGTDDATYRDYNLSRSL